MPFYTKIDLFIDYTRLAWSILISRWSIAREAVVSEVSVITYCGSCTVTNLLPRHTLFNIF